MRQSWYNYSKRCSSLDFIRTFKTVSCCVGSCYVARSCAFPCFKFSGKHFECGKNKGPHRCYDDFQAGDMSVRQRTERMKLSFYLLFSFAACLRGVELCENGTKLHRCHFQVTTSMVTCTTEPLIKNPYISPPAPLPHDAARGEIKLCPKLCSLSFTGTRSVHRRIAWLSLWARTINSKDGHHCCWMRRRAIRCRRLTKVTPDFVSVLLPYLQVGSWYFTARSVHHHAHFLEMSYSPPDSRYRRLQFWRNDTMFLSTLLWLYPDHLLWETKISVR